MRALPVILITVALLAGCVSLGAELEPGTLPDPAPGGFSTTSVHPGEYVLNGSFSRTVTAGIFDFLPDELVTLRSDLDGVKIEIGVVRPDVPDGEQVPVIVHASPYYSPLSTLNMRERVARLAENFVPHGYAVALVPIRGTADHGGCMDLMGKAERADLDQAITWLGEQPWSNGAIGMIGVSYDGSTPWMVAGTGNAYLKTIVPISGVNDLWHLMYRNGTAEARGLLLLNALYYQYGFAQYNVMNGRGAENSLVGIVCPESLKGLGMAGYSTFAGERDPSGFWAERNSRPLVEANYRGSILNVQGLQDWNVEPAQQYPWVNKLEEQGIVVKHLLGQWGHAWPDSRPENNPNARWDWAEILLNWFDYWLKGDTTADLGPRAQVQDSSGKWRNEDSWPPRDAQPRTWFLAPDKKLVDEPSSNTAIELLVPGMQGRSDVVGLVADDCPTNACLWTEPFETDFRFAGLPQVHVNVMPTGPGGHLSAHLWIDDGGRLTRAGWGQIDLRFADGGEAMKTVTPYMPLKVHLELEPLDVVVPAGARLYMTIGQTSYSDHVPSTPTYPVWLRVGGDLSTFTVQTFERSADVFFTPPGV